MKVLILLIFASSNLLAQITFTMQDAQNLFSFGKKQVTHDNLQLSNTFIDLKNPSTTVAQNWILPNIQFQYTYDGINLDLPNYQFVNNFPSATHINKNPRKSSMICMDLRYNFYICCAY